MNYFTNIEPLKLDYRQELVILLVQAINTDFNMAKAKNQPEY
jgi:hypothetical protein